MTEVPNIPPPPVTPGAGYSKLNTSLWILFLIAGSLGIIQGILTVFRGVLYVNLDRNITNDKEDAAEVIDNLVSTSLGLNMWLALAIFVLLIIYTYRIVKKVRGAGFSVRMPDGFAIGAWFIPLGNAILCFLYYLDIAKADEARRSRNLLFLNLWWWLYLIGVHGTMLFETLSGDSKYYLDAGYLSFAGAGFAIVAVVSAGFAVLFFRQIREFESALDRGKLMHGRD